MIVSHCAKTPRNVKSLCIALERVAVHMQVDAYLDWPETMRDINLKNVTVHYEPFKDITDPSKIIVYTSDELLFTPDAFLIVSEMLNNVDYVSGYDAPSTTLASVLHVASRWWKVPGTMTKHFAARGSTIIQDALIIKEYDEKAWKLLRLMHNRKCASPMPSIWQIEGAPVSPAVPWETFR